MAPAKRKRTDRASVDGGDSRPSPHRPGNMTLGQHDGGNRRGSRGDRGGGRGGGGRGRNDRNDRNDVNRVPVSAPASTPNLMSPPLRPSSTTQTPIQPSTPIVEAPPSTPKTNPLPYDYFFLTDERVASWKESGRQEVIALGVQARQDEDTADLASIFQEFLRATLDGRLGATDAGSCVETILGPAVSPGEGAFDSHTLLIDILSIICDTEPTPISPSVRQFITATGVAPALLRQNLDAQILGALGLTRETFYRVGIRHATHLLYRQANFNLLREESEGYSKLVNELYVSTTEEGDKSDVVRGAFEKVKGLIGTFNLDVGRVLDITLDVFAALLVSRYRFFICFLRQSSWWPRHDTIPGVTLPELLPPWALAGSNDFTTSPEDAIAAAERKNQRDTHFWRRAREVGLDAFFELAGHQVLDEETRQRVLHEAEESDDSELGIDRQWIKGTGTLPPQGNQTAAQLLGFKLRFYDSDARDKDDIFPQNLLYLTALLIKVGFISLRDIYPHLSPSDEDMESFKTSKLAEISAKERENRPGAKANALMMAAALPDDTLPSGGRPRDAKADAVDKNEEKDKKQKVDDPQKVQLLNYLLTIGAIPESLFILGQFPWLSETNPELINLINRIINYSIDSVYTSLCSPIDLSSIACPGKLIADYNQSGLPKGDIRLTSLPAKAVKKWPFPDKNDDKGTNYRYYWDDWADNVPVCQSIDDVFTLASTFLNCSGIEIGRDTSLLTKLARIGNTSLSQDSSQHNLSRWQDLLKRIIVPALSFTHSNASIVNEVFDMLRHYAVPVRYSIYAEWFEGQISRMPVMQKEFSRTEAEAMGIMKRISKTNIPTMARSLAKVAYASPGIVFRVALGQIEVYTNLTEVVVECAKYFTDLGYDVLVWSLMSALGSDRKRSSRDSPLLPSDWLLALSRFTGKIFKRYSIINPSSILQYVNHQLYRNSSMDLQVLKELIAQMAGIVPNIDFNDAELTAMTGWEMLRKITLINAKDNRYSSEKTSKRFTKSLLDTRLAGELLVGIAQYRQSAIYSVDEDVAHIKFLATIVDDTQSILLQYLDLLRSVLSVEDFDKHVPDIPELLTDFGLQPALAFMIGRLSVLSQIAVATSPVKNGTPKSVAVSDLSVIKPIDADGDVDMAKDVVLDTTELEAAQGEADGEAKEAGSPVVKDQSPIIVGDVNEPVLDKFQQCLEPIVSAVKGLHPEDSWKHISPEFYVTFWVTTLSEIIVPKSSYDAVGTKLKADLKALARTDGSRTTNADRTQQKLALADEEIALSQEKIKHMEYAQKLKLRFNRRKSSWFHAAGKADALSDDILEKCLLPRLLQSRTDADFCFSIIKYMHETGTPNFRLLSLYSRIFRTHRLRSIIFTCTSREAENLGRFLRSILEDLARWHADEKVYLKEAHGSVTNPHLIGFAKALDDDGKPKGFLEYKGERGFRNVLFQWHKNINSAIRDCLEGVEWMHIRNAVTVLQSVSVAFPAVDFMGAGFIKQLENIADREKDARADLALAANSAIVPLKKAERLKSWVTVQSFGNPIVNAAAQQNGIVSTPSQNTSVNKTVLKPTAAEFKPRISNVTISSSKPAANEVEDGEVDDSKKSKVPNKSADTPAVQDHPQQNEQSSVTPAPAEPPKKSEILLRREQHLREKAAAANQASQSVTPTRAESIRYTSSASGPQNPASLPTRPDAPFPSRQDLDRHPRHADRRDTRDLRGTETQRSGRTSDRAGERVADRPRELLSDDRRHPELNARESGRPAERLQPLDRARPTPPPRWTGDSPREHPERLSSQGRGAEINRLPREGSLPLSRTETQDRGRVETPERAPSINPQRQELINPARAALISNGDLQRESPRYGREDFRERDSMRTQSPRRPEAEKDGADPRRDERSGRSNGEESYHNGRGRQDEHQYPPAGPRSDRVPDRSMERVPNERNNFQPTTHMQTHTIDPDHGRLNPPSRAQVDPNFGRLNAAPSNDIPSGPRAPNSRGNRPQPQPSMNQTPRRENLRGHSPPQQPPSGPSSARHSRRTDSGQFNVNSLSTPTSLPSTPTGPSPVVAVHPDRLRQLPVQAQAVPSPRAEAASASIGVGMHPDRARAYGVDVPVNQQTNNSNRSAGPPQHSPSSNSGPPSGPKITQVNPVSSVNNVNNMSAPTGPASANDRSQRGGRRQLAGINTMLQQANTTPGIQVRGRGRASAGGFGDNPNSMPSPLIQQNSTQDMSRSEPQQDSRELVNPMRADLIANVPSHDDRDRERSRRREHTGHSRRSSRSPGRERSSSKREPGNGEHAGPDYRDRRGGERNDERDRYAGRIEPPHDLIARDVKAVPRDASGRPHDRERHDRPERDFGRQRDGRDIRDVQGQTQGQHEPWNHGGGDRNEHRNGGPERGDRGSERGGRSRDLRNEHDRRDSRGSRGGDDGRKRHSDGVEEIRGREKRPRRG